MHASIFYYLPLPYGESFASLQESCATPKVAETFSERVVYVCELIERFGVVLLQPHSHFYTMNVISPSKVGLFWR
jgi:hypothetical protein